MSLNLSYLDLIDICDNVQIHRPTPEQLYDLKYKIDAQADKNNAGHGEHLVPFALNPSPESPIIGLLRPIIVQQLRLENERSRQLGVPEIWDLHLDFDESQSRGSPRRVSFQNWLDTPSKRTAAMREICERWRDTKLFDDVCGPKKWRAELYPIYADPFGVLDHPGDDSPQAEGTKQPELNFVFEMERSACALFGVVTYGVHMSIYQEALGLDGERSLAVWVPTRARTKPTFPGFLDNTVAGGIPSGMPVFESLVKECMEEASLGVDVVRKHVRGAGAISYFFRTSKGCLQPEVEYVYDLPIPPGADPTLFEPRPSDGEVESFELMTQDKLIEKLRLGLFKPNCALVLIDLFIRLGYITPDNEPDFMNIITRLHSRFDYEKWKG